MKYYNVLIMPINANHRLLLFATHMILIKEKGKNSVIHYENKLFV